MLASQEKQVLLRIEQRVTPDSNGFSRTIVVRGVPRGGRIKLRALSEAQMSAAKISDRGTTVTMLDDTVRIFLERPSGARFEADGTIVSREASGTDRELVFGLRYRTKLPNFNVEHTPSLKEPPKITRLNVLPGYEAVRLPIDDEWMPTGFAWRLDGTMVVTSLKGRVWLAHDSDGDGLEDKIKPFSDELAAPFGAACGDDYIDVINKYALLRLYDKDGDGRAERTVTLASGWGHTADYHDWAVGLPRDNEGNYYVAFSCEQDNRSKSAAHLRGKVVKLVPREPTLDDPRRFDVRLISGGHRFPVGIARNRDGQLFVPDNQGNFNPFNELNHVVQGARYGFLNSTERKTGVSSPLTPPAIDIPHPWTRSVNGICFLETPPEVREKLGRDLFGPLEGHLIGCEYDTRRLIRMSLQRVGDTYQGAAYPFSFDKPPSGEPLLGPITCAVAPDGDIYVGCIRDSGWGGANNVGTLVRIRPLESGLPAGIAEVRAVKGGFAIEFTKPIDRAKAAERSNYSVSSYTRVSTPNYGGDDKQRRIEKVSAIVVSPDARRVTLMFDELRENFVYEFRLKNLTDDKLFFPAEAFYTLRTIPK